MKKSNINFIKKGLIYCQKKSKSSPFVSHNVRPNAFKINKNTLRIFFNSRLVDDTPSISFVDVDIDNPKKIKKINKKIIIPHGVLGSYDSDGINLTNIFKKNKQYMCDCVGWSRSRYKITINMGLGLCKLNTKNNLPYKISDGPIIHKDSSNPLGACASYTLKDKNYYRMWYCRVLKWIKAKHGMEMIYTIHHAKSKDLKNWNFTKKPSINQKFKTEVVSSPTVIKNKSGYHMWFSHRDSISKKKKKFRLGYAFSKDGVRWKRQDNKNIIKPSKNKNDWDYDSICYLTFYKHKNKTYAFYSGSGTGKGGFGYAETENFY